MKLHETFSSGGHLLPAVLTRSLPTMRTILCLAIVLLLLVPSSVQGQIEKKVSPVNESVRLVSQDMRILVTDAYPGHASFRAEYEKPPGASPTWRLSFYGFTDDTTSLHGASTVRLRVDGQPVSPLEVRTDTRALDDQLLEIKRLDLSRSNFQKIATADEVHATIGSFDFELTGPSRKDLRLILERVPEDGQSPRVTDTGSDS